MVKLQPMSDNKTHQYNEIVEAILLANAIIYYNTSLLSVLLEREEQTGNEEAIQLIKKVSPIAWQHIHIYGSYQFSMNGFDAEIEKIASDIQVI